MAEAAKYKVDPKVASEALDILMPKTLLRKQNTVYFAHAQPVYGTQEEKANIYSIAQWFKGYRIVNPADIKELHIRDMDFYLGVVEKCDALVFTKFRGFVMGGVGKEAERAYELGKAVYELSEIGFTRMAHAPEYLSHDETVALLVKVGFRKEQPKQVEPGQVS